MQAAGLTVSQIEGVLQANNITLPAGQITSNGQTLPVQVGNTFASLDDLKNLVVGVSVPPTSPATGTVPGSRLDHCFPPGYRRQQQLHAYHAR